jgi:hypothetical protein
MSINPKEIEEVRLQTEEWLKTAKPEELRKVLQRTDPSAVDVPSRNSQANKQKSRQKKTKQATA